MRKWINENRDPVIARIYPVSINRGENKNLTGLRPRMPMKSTGLMATQSMLSISGSQILGVYLREGLT